MYKSTKYYIVLIVSVVVVVVYLSQSLIGLITHSNYIWTKDIVDAVNVNLLTNLVTENDTAEKGSNSCYDTQKKARNVVQDYCKSKSENWTEVICLFTHTC